ncbi:MAG: hypothetical protein Q8N03_04300 [Ignavibacteria bacterium]|nr:hypothetical protein [Ignavibacteria bacterium]
MKKNIILFLMMLFIISLSSVMAQTMEQKEWLRKFSAEQDAKFKMNYLEAELFAASQNMPISYKNADGSIMVLAGHENGRLIYDATDNLIAARSVSTDKVWQQGGIGIYNLSGSGQILV